MIKTRLKIFIFFLFFITPIANWGNNLFFIQEKVLAKDIVSMKVKEFNQYVGVVFLEKSSKNFSLKFQTYLEKELLTEIEIEKFQTPTNINFDFSIDANTLYLVYQNPNNQILYQRLESIYSKPLVSRKDIISQEDGMVYSVPSLYRMGKKIYIFFHKESDKNKLDIQLRIAENGSDFTQPLNFTENLGYAIYPKLVVLRDRLGVFFQAREQDTQGKIYFDIFYHQINLEGTRVLEKHKLTQNMGDNYSVQGFFMDNKYFLTWENRLNSWRIFYSAIDLNSGKMLLSPKSLTSSFYNYRKPNIVKMGDLTYLLVQKIESGSNDQLYAYQIFNDGSISSEMATGIYLNDYSMVATNTIFLFGLKQDGSLFRKEIDRFTSPIQLVPFFAEREIFSTKNLNMQWKPIADESGVEALFYTFDKNPNTIPDEFSKLNPETTAINLYAPEDGTWYFHLYYQDKAKNKSPVIHKKIVIDTSIPLTPLADFSANQVLDPPKNLIDNTENVSIQWLPTEGSHSYLYALSLYPKFFPHTAKNIQENQITFPSLKPGKYFFHLQAVNAAGTKGEVISTPFYIKKITDASETFFDPEATLTKKVYIRQILVKNINLIPITPYLSGGKKPYRVIPFWEMPVTLKLKIALIAILIFIIIFLLYLILFARHKKLIFAYENLKNTPLPSSPEIHALEEILEGEITVLPGVGDLMIAHMSQDQRLAYKELIQRAEHLDQDIHKLETKIDFDVNIQVQEKKEVIESAIEEAKEFIHDAEEILHPQTILPQDTKKVYEITDALEIEEAQEITDALEIEEAQEITDALEIEEAQEITDALEIEEAQEITDALEVEEAQEITDALEIEEAQEITDALEVEEAQEITDALEIEEAQEITDALEIEEAQEITDAAKVIEKKEPIPTAAEKVIIEDRLTQEVEEVKEESPAPTPIQKEFKERIKLRLKYSFLITILVMFTVGTGSLVNGYFSLKQIKETLSIENIKRAEIAVTTLAINTKVPLQVKEDALIVDAVSNTKSIEDVLYSQVIKRDLDINTGKEQWFYRDNKGQFTMLKDHSIIQKLMLSINQEKKAKVFIEPHFTLQNVLKEYTLYYPIIHVEDESFNLTQKDFGTRFLGVARIDFSTARIFEILDNQRSQIFNLTIIIASIMVALGLLGAIFLAYFTVKPISRLVQGVQVVGGGDLTHQIEITTKDEIGRLTFEFNKMTSQLLVAQEESIKQKVLEEQFSIAEGIQKSLIPQEDLMLKDVEIAGFYQAALGVGGDYYDFFEIDQDRVGLVLSDVAGKGIPAALVMVNIRTVFKTNIKKPNITPKEIINILNNVLAEDLANDMFATLFFLIYNRKTKEAVYCNAGHGPFTYYSYAQKKVIQPPTAQTMPLGVMADNPQYVNEKFTLSSEDFIIIYTDGISEAMDIDHEEYGEPRLFETMEKLCKANLSTQAITRGIIDDVEEFAGEAPQSDDISMILMKIK